MQEFAALIIFFASLHVRKGCQLLIIKLCWVVLRMRSSIETDKRITLSWGSTSCNM